MYICIFFISKHNCLIKPYPSDCSRLTYRVRILGAPLLCSVFWGIVPSEVYVELLKIVLIFVSCDSILFFADFMFG